MLSRTSRIFQLLRGKTNLLFPNHSTMEPESLVESGSALGKRSLTDMAGELNARIAGASSEQSVITLSQQSPSNPSSGNGKQSRDDKADHRSNKNRDQYQGKGRWAKNGRREQREWSQPFSSSTSSASADGAEKGDRVPKKKQAILFGYSGSKYFGLQINGQLQTVEKVLEQTLFDAGFIIPENRDMQKIHWSRACRTDKGVHAAANVISLKMNVVDNPEQKINALLPDDIRVFAVLKTSKTFNCWTSCSERRYEYTMPSFCLQPRHEYLAEFTRFANQYRAEHPELQLPEVKFADSALQPTLGLVPGDDGINHQDLDAAFGVPQEIIDAYPPFPSTFRISQQNKDNLNQLLTNYLGTHSFHNFTIRRKPNDPSTSRFIKGVEAVDTFTNSEGVEFVRILVKGQSFMLHQIRKMMGTAMAMARGLIPSTESVWSTLFDRNSLFLTPMAPAEGLFLDRCYFSNYNLKIEQQAQMEHRLPVEWDRYETEVEAFKREKIHPCILDQSYNQKAFVKWLSKSLDRPHYWAAMQAGNIVTRKDAAVEADAGSESDGQISDGHGGSGGEEEDEDDEKSNSNKRHRPFQRQGGSKNSSNSDGSITVAAAASCSLFLSEPQLPSSTEQSTPAL